MADRPKGAGKSSLDHVDQETLLNALCSSPADHILDLACGAGRYSLVLAQRLSAEGRIHGLDLWQDGIAELQQQAQERGFTQITAAVADLCQPLPLPAQSFDSAFIATALHDLPVDKRRDFIAEVKRVLKPQGQFAVIEFKKRSDGPGPPLHVRLSVQDLAELILPSGFRAVGNESLGEFVYMSLFRKQ